MSPHRDRAPRGRHGMATLLVLLPLAGCGSGDAQRAGRPDVILISLDTLRQDHCGFHGYERDTTPFLDSLAADSLVFDRAYSTASWTLIAHMSMLTGLYPVQHEVWESTAALWEGVPLLSQLLAAAGAVTGGVHFPGWLDGKFGFDRGYEYYFSAKDVTDAKARLDTFVPGLADDWSFLFIHLFDIHSASLEPVDSLIYDTKPPYDTMFDPEAPAVLEGMNAKEVFHAIPADFTPRMRDAVVALYDGGIRSVDDRLREWFAEWTELGLLDNAIVIITSDHGEGLAQREYRFGGHGSMFEEGLRVPLMIHATPEARRWLARYRDLEPESMVGRRDDLVSHVDIVPTLLDMLDLPAVVEYPGYSMVRDVPADRFAHAQRGELAVSYREREKVCYDTSGRIKLYVDLREDPRGAGERRPKDEATLERATALAEDALAATRALPKFGAPTSNGGLDEAERAALEGLGYAAELEEH